MRTLVIGDTHGRPTWKRLVREPWDRVVFLGDYFDSYEDFSPAEQLYNFNEIIAFRDEAPDRTTLLVGNHDYHYVTPGENYSGYQHRFAAQIGQAILDVKDKLQLCVEDQGWLLSHAGVTLPFCRRIHISTEYLTDELNGAWTLQPGLFRFWPEDYEGYGDHFMQGPLWVRPKSLMACPAHPKQIVGHTYQQKGVFMREFEGDQFVFADALPRQFVVITDGQVTAHDVSTF